MSFGVIESNAAILYPARTCQHAWMRSMYLKYLRNFTTQTHSPRKAWQSLTKKFCVSWKISRPCESVQKTKDCWMWVERRVWLPRNVFKQGRLIITLADDPPVCTFNSIRSVPHQVLLNRSKLVICNVTCKSAFFPLMQKIWRKRATTWGARSDCS